MTGPVLVLIEHDRGVPAETAYQALALARAVADDWRSAPVEAVLIGDDAERLAADVERPGAAVRAVRHPALDDYAPGGLGCVHATGRAARSAPKRSWPSGPIEATRCSPTWPPSRTCRRRQRHGDRAHQRGMHLTRVRWGGSLLERPQWRPPSLILTPPLMPSRPPNRPRRGRDPTDRRGADPELDPRRAHPHRRAGDPAVGRHHPGRRHGRGERRAGRGLGRRLRHPGGAGRPARRRRRLLRVVTNNGWRPHSDQVGQTGKRIAPELYIACGISGAIQHWVGMMAAKRVLAINTDKDAPMVTKADYAVLGDLHAILPAVVAELPAIIEGDRAPNRCKTEPGRARGGSVDLAPAGYDEAAERGPASAGADASSAPPVLECRGVWKVFGPRLTASSARPRRPDPGRAGPARQRARPSATSRSRVADG